MPHPPLSKFFRCSADKAVNKWDSYFRFYDSLLYTLVGKDIRLLEIGVSHGGSLEMWADYFGPGCSIVGIDVDPLVASLKFSRKNIQCRLLDQNDSVGLTNLASEYGGFDVVIDDGCHSDPAILNSLRALWPSLRDGGMYFVEDIHGTFWDPMWQKGTSIHEFILNETASLQHLGSRGVIHNTGELTQLRRVSVEWSIACFEKGSDSDDKKTCLVSENGCLRIHNQF